MSVPNEKPEADLEMSVPSEKPEAEHDESVPSEKPGVERSMTVAAEKPSAERRMSAQGEKSGAERRVRGPGERSGAEGAKSRKGGAVVSLKQPGRDLQPTRHLRLVTNAEHREFLPAALEIIDTPASPRRLALIWILSLMLAASLIWSCVAKLDIYATAQGRIQPSGRSKVVQSVDPGKIKTIAVENGSKVKAGDVLLELDPTDAYAERDAAAADLEALDAEIPRRNAEILAATSGTPTKVSFPSNVGRALQQREQKVLDAELSQYQASQATLEAQLAGNAATMTRLKSSIAARERMIAVLQKRVDMKSELLEKQAGTLSAALDAQQQLEQQLIDQAKDKGELLEADATSVATQKKIDQGLKQFVADQTDKLSDAQRKRDHMAQDLIKAVGKAERTRLTAPIDGTVQQLAITTVGQVITAGQPLLVVVPEHSTLEIEALIANADMGFIELGQDAVIKIDAFPFGRYGSLDGKVVRVSGDSVYNKDLTSTDATVPQGENASVLDSTPKTQNLVYPVTVELTQRSMHVDGKDVPLAPGMTAVVEIRTGDRRVIDYLLSPLREVAMQAAHER